MLMWPDCDVVIPAHPNDWLSLQQLLRSLHRQTYPKERLKVHVITEGNSEEAKAMGILRSQGDYIALFCADNDLLTADFLETLVTAAIDPTVVGAYTTQYAYVPTDTALSRYFALLGANDPLCWWLRRCDRQDYLSPAPPTTQRTFRVDRPLPSLGDNGCVYKAALLRSVVTTPQAFGSCMCICADLARHGYTTWAVVGTQATWHRTGESFWRYLRKRWRYVNDLYFDRLVTRRWVLVSSLRDWGLVCLFALHSVLVVPALCVSLWGYRHVRDPAWGLHLLLSYCLTLLYTCALMRHLLISLWLSLRLIVRRS